MPVEKSKTNKPKKDSSNNPKSPFGTMTSKKAKSEKAKLRVKDSNSKLALSSSSSSKTPNEVSRRPSSSSRKSSLRKSVSLKRTASKGISSRIKSNLKSISLTTLASATSSNPGKEVNVKTKDTTKSISSNVKTAKKTQSIRSSPTPAPSINSVSGSALVGSLGDGLDSLSNNKVIKRKSSAAKLSKSKENPKTVSSISKIKRTLSSKPSSIGKLKPSSIGKLKPSSIGKLKPSSIGKLKPSSMGTLKPSSMGTLKPSSMGTLKPSSMGTLKPSSIGKLKPSSISKLKPSSIGKLKPSSISKLKPSSIGKPKPSSIGKPVDSSSVKLDDGAESKPKDGSSDKFEDSSITKIKGSSIGKLEVIEPKKSKKTALIEEIGNAPKADNSSMEEYSNIKTFFIVKKYMAADGQMYEEISRNIAITKIAITEKIVKRLVKGDMSREEMISTFPSIDSAFSVPKSILAEITAREPSMLGSFEYPPGMTSNDRSPSSMGGSKRPMDAILSDLEREPSMAMSDAEFKELMAKPESQMTTNELLILKMRKITSVKGSTAQSGSGEMVELASGKPLTSDGLSRELSAQIKPDFFEEVDERRRLSDASAPQFGVQAGTDRIIAPSEGMLVSAAAREPSAEGGRKISPGFLDTPMPRDGSLARMPSEVGREPSIVDGSSSSDTSTQYGAAASLAREPSAAGSVLIADPSQLGREPSAAGGGVPGAPSQLGRDPSGMPGTMGSGIGVGTFEGGAFPGREASTPQGTFEGNNDLSREPSGMSGTMGSGIGIGTFDGKAFPGRESSTPLGNNDLAREPSRMPSLATPEPSLPGREPTELFNIQLPDTGGKFSALAREASNAASPSFGNMSGGLSQLAREPSGAAGGPGDMTSSGLGREISMPIVSLTGLPGTTPSELNREFYGVGREPSATPEGGGAGQSNLAREPSSNVGQGAGQPMGFLDTPLPTGASLTRMPSEAGREPSGAAISFDFGREPSGLGPPQGSDLGREPSGAAGAAGVAGQSSATGREPSGAAISFNFGREPSGVGGPQASDLFREPSGAAGVAGQSSATGREPSGAAISFDFGREPSGAGQLTPEASALAREPSAAGGPNFDLNLGLESSGMQTKQPMGFLDTPMPTGASLTRMPSDASREPSMAGAGPFFDLAREPSGAAGVAGQPSATGREPSGAAISFDFGREPSGVGGPKGSDLFREPSGAPGAGEQQLGREASGLNGPETSLSTMREPSTFGTSITGGPSSLGREPSAADGVIKGEAINGIQSSHLGREPSTTSSATAAPTMQPTSIPIDTSLAREPSSALPRIKSALISSDHEPSSPQKDLVMLKVKRKPSTSISKKAKSITFAPLLEGAIELGREPSVIAPWKLPDIEATEHEISSIPYTNAERESASHKELVVMKFKSVDSELLDTSPTTLVREPSSTRPVTIKELVAMKIKSAPLAREPSFSITSELSGFQQPETAEASLDHEPIHKQLVAIKIKSVDLKKREQSTMKPDSAEISPTNLIRESSITSPVTDTCKELFIMKIKSAAVAQESSLKPKSSLAEGEIELGREPSIPYPSKLSGYSEPEPAADADVIMSLESKRKELVLMKVKSSDPHCEPSSEPKPESFAIGTLPTALAMEPSISLPVTSKQKELIVMKVKSAAMAQEPSCKSKLELVEGEIELGREPSIAYTPKLPDYSGPEPAGVDAMSFDHESNRKELILMKVKTEDSHLEPSSAPKPDSFEVGALPTALAIESSTQKELILMKIKSKAIAQEPRSKPKSALAKDENELYHEPIFATAVVPARPDEMSFDQEPSHKELFVMKVKSAHLHREPSLPSKPESFEVSSAPIKEASALPTTNTQKELIMMKIKSTVLAREPSSQPKSLEVKQSSQTLSNEMRHEPTAMVAVNEKPALSEGEMELGREPSIAAALALPDIIDRPQDTLIKSAQSVPLRAKYKPNDVQSQEPKLLTIIKFKSLPMTDLPAFSPAAQETSTTPHPQQRLDHLEGPIEAGREPSITEVQPLFSHPNESKNPKSNVDITNALMAAKPILRRLSKGSGSVSSFVSPCPSSAQREPSMGPGANYSSQFPSGASELGREPSGMPGGTPEPTASQLGREPSGALPDGVILPADAWREPSALVGIGEGLPTEVGRESSSQGSPIGCPSQLGREPSGVTAGTSESTLREPSNIAQIKTPPYPDLSVGREPSAQGSFGKSMDPSQASLGREPSSGANGVILPPEAWREASAIVGVGEGLPNELGREASGAPGAQTSLSTMREPSTGGLTGVPPEFGREPSGQVGLFGRESTQMFKVNGEGSESQTGLNRDPSGAGNAVEISPSQVGREISTTAGPMYGQELGREPSAAASFGAGVGQDPSNMGAGAAIAPTMREPSFVESSASAPGRAPSARDPSGMAFVAYGEGGREPSSGMVDPAQMASQIGREPSGAMSAFGVVPPGTQEEWNSKPSGLPTGFLDTPMPIGNSLERINSVTVMREPSVDMSPQSRDGSMTGREPSMDSGVPGIVPSQLAREPSGMPLGAGASESTLREPSDIAPLKTPPPIGETLGMLGQSPSQLGREPSFNGSFTTTGTMDQTQAGSMGLAREPSEAPGQSPSQLGRDPSFNGSFTTAGTMDQTQAGSMGLAREPSEAPGQSPSQFGREPSFNGSFTTAGTMDQTQAGSMGLAREASGAPGQSPSQLGREPSFNGSFTAVGPMDPTQLGYIGLAREASEAPGQSPSQLGRDPSFNGSFTTAGMMDQTQAGSMGLAREPSEAPGQSPSQLGRDPSFNGSFTTAGTMDPTQAGSMGLAREPSEAPGQSPSQLGRDPSFNGSFTTAGTMDPTQAGSMELAREASGAPGQGLSLLGREPSGAPGAQASISTMREPSDTGVQGFLGTPLSTSFDRMPSDLSRERSTSRTGFNDSMAGGGGPDGFPAQPSSSSMPPGLEAMAREASFGMLGVDPMLSLSKLEMPYQQGPLFNEFAKVDGLTGTAQPQPQIIIFRPTIVIVQNNIAVPSGLLQTPPAPAPETVPGSPDSYVVFQNQEIFIYPNRVDTSNMSGAYTQNSNDPNSEPFLKFENTR